MIITKNEVKKIMKLKILIGIGLLFLLIGSVAAFEISSLKTLDGYDGFDKSGYSNYTTNSNRYFLVEKISELDDDFKEEWFTDHPEYKYTSEAVGNNIFRVNDDTFNFYGYQEVIEADGDYYMVSINQNSKLSPSEETEFLSDLNDFNKLNSLEPIAI